MSTPDPALASLKTENLDAIVAAEQAGAPTVPAYPMRLTVELTADCNLRCPHCEFTPGRAWKEKHDPNRILDVNIEDLRRFAAKVFPHIHELVPSVSGEPMMYPHWDELVGLCEQYGVVIDMYTNGTYITRERLEQARSVLSRIIVSMDGASPETFNVLRKPSEFDDVCARLDVLKAWREELTPDQRPFVHIHGTLTLQWVDELSEMVRLAARYGVDELTIGYLIAASDYWRAQQPSNEPERVDAALREASATAQELGVSVSLPKLFGSGESVSVSAGSAMPVESRVDVPPAPTGGPKYWCKYLWRELFIQQGGEVAPCCGQGRPDVDNVNRNPDLQSIFNDPVLQEMRNGMTTGDLHPACAQCNLLSQYGDLGYAEASFEGDYTTLNGMLAEQQKRGRES